MCPSLKCSAIALWHFCIKSLACVVFSWFLVVSDAAAAVIVIVSLLHCCFLVLLLFELDLLRLTGVSWWHFGGSDAVAYAYEGAGLTKSFLMSFRSFTICSVVLFLLFSSSFSRFSVICLASSIMPLAFSIIF